MTLPGPITKGPIYRCAKIVAFSGVQRDSKITIFVNGVNRVQKNTWMGWGAVVLPTPLKIGDEVSATQEVNGNISGKTRDPVTVEDFPSNIKISGKLKRPTIIPPLYDCQRAIMVSNVLEGTTVTVRSNRGQEFERETPYNNTTIRTRPLEYNQMWEAK